MFTRRTAAVHPRGILAGLLDRLRGREQRLVRAGEDVPLLLLSYPRGASQPAREIELAWTHTLPRLSADTLAAYRPALEALRSVVVVVLLHPFNPCQCLGHHHPRGTESRLTRRLQADLGRSVGEIDLAYKGIEHWRPEPLATLAASASGQRIEAIHFQAAALAVLLHELEHLAFPQHSEHDTRLRSNHFYTQAMQQLAAPGTAYGIASRPGRRL